jgi:hypothetical protein
MKPGKHSSESQVESHQSRNVTRLDWCFAVFCRRGAPTRQRNKCFIYKIIMQDRSVPNLRSYDLRNRVFSVRPARPQPR